MAMRATKRAIPTCPECGARGKRVGQTTLESLVRPEFRNRIGAGPWFFCRAPACRVVYFTEGGASLDKDAVLVRVGIKESEPPRLLCYCFDHTQEEIEAEVAATGSSTIPDRIAERCKQGLDDCEHKNPKGSCCLGDVRAAVAAARGGLPVAAPAGQAPAGQPPAGQTIGDCCSKSEPSASAGSASDSASPGAPPEGAAAGATAARSGRLAAAGAVAAAVLSSACCWLPLLLLAFGASAAGLSGFFERFRPWFLGLSALLLGAGFYFVYFRAPACEPGSACARSDARLARFNKAMLWIAAAFVAVFAFFPNYAGALLGGSGGGASADARASGPDLEIEVGGMTCKACSAALRSELEGLPGVASAEVLYEEGKARLRFTAPGEGPTLAAVAATVRKAGYEPILPRTDGQADAP